MTEMKLGEIVDIRSGVAFRKAIEPSSSGTHYVLQAKDVLSGRLDMTDLQLVELGERGDQHKLAVGEVIMVSRGRNVAAPVPASIRPEPIVAAGSVYVLHVKTETLDPTYLCWAINQPQMQVQLKTLAQGSHIPFVSKQSLADLELPVPSIDIQRAIGHVYELSLREKGLMSQLSELREQLMHALCLAAAQEQKE